MGLLKYKGILPTLGKGVFIAEGAGEWLSFTPRKHPIAFGSWRPGGPYSTELKTVEFYNATSAVTSIRDWHMWATEPDWK
jgi:hypothetical protein